MHKFRHVGVVDHVYGYGFAFAHSQHRAGRCIVISNGAEDVVWREFDRDGGDAEGIVRPGRGDGGSTHRHSLLRRQQLWLCCLRKG
jgi:hypothetical protein